MEHNEKIKIAEEILRMLVYIKGKNPEADINKISGLTEYILENNEFRERRLLLAAILYKGFEFADADFYGLSKIFGKRIVEIFAQAKIYSERNRSIDLSEETKMLLMSLAVYDNMVNENNVFFYKELLENSKGVSKNLEKQLEKLCLKTINKLENYYFNTDANVCPRKCA